MKGERKSKKETKKESATKKTTTKKEENSAETSKFSQVSLTQMKKITKGEPNELQKLFIAQWKPQRTVLLSNQVGRTTCQFLAVSEALQKDKKVLIVAPTIERQGALKRRLANWFDNFNQLTETSKITLVTLVNLKKKGLINGTYLGEFNFIVIDSACVMEDRNQSDELTLLLAEISKQDLLVTTSKKGKVTELHNAAIVESLNKVNETNKIFKVLVDPSRKLDFLFTNEINQTYKKTCIVFNTTEEVTFFQAVLNNLKLDTSSDQNAKSRTILITADNLAATKLKPDCLILFELIEGTKVPSLPKTKIFQLLSKFDQVAESDSSSFVPIDEAKLLKVTPKVIKYVKKDFLFYDLSKKAYKAFILVPI